MDVDNENLVAIETRLRNEKYRYCGISVDLYQFKYDRTTTWNHGQIFHANRIGELSFEGKGSTVDHIDALDPIHKRDAVFLVHEENMQQEVESVLMRSLEVKHDGILRPYGVGYSSQISKVVSGYRADHTRTFADWLAAQNPSLTSIPVTIPLEVQHLISTGFQAIETIWEGGSTSDSLENPGSYVMVNNRIKIDPLCLRDQKEGDEKMKLRRDFASLILNHIYRKWKDDELLDLIELLKNNNPRAAKIILGAPVLLSPPRREVMYFQYYQAGLLPKKQNWLEREANLGGGWKNVARNEDTALRSIIDLQVQRDRLRVGFTPDLKGALHFASVVTSHYLQHFKDTAEARLGVDRKNRVDWLLKKVLPRLLSRLYNTEHM